MAVDVAIEWLQSEGAEMASVELGGDLRVFGTPWYGDRWRIDVVDQLDRSKDIATFTPTEGAVTTSTTLRRAWTDQGRHYHHILDPRTGWPSTNDVVSVSTCSSQAWWAEVAAKSALVAGAVSAPALLEHLGTPGIIVTASGEVIVAQGAGRLAGSASLSTTA